jgi:vitellogenic carboxypeptidase-like protein
MNKAALILLALVATSHCLYTSSYWTKKGHNVKDGILPEEKNDNDIFLETSCNELDLSTAPFNHSGAVHSGYLNVGKSGSALAFILYGKQGAPKADLKNFPTIIWLNGGPGSSSQLGNFMELGPSFVKPASMAPYEIVANAYTWIKDYNVLFVDQPVGTGLSYADPNFKPSPYCTNMSQVADDFYKALTELYFSTKGCFNILGITGDKPLFIFGESYAGKYAPAIGSKIKSEQLKNAGKITGLKGVAVGDGFTHPAFILSQVGEFAYNMGMIDYQERSMIEHILLNGTYQQRARDWDSLHDTFDLALDLIVKFAGNVNVYDITKFRDYPTQLLESFFSSPDIISRFKLNPNVTYAAQADKVYEALYTDFMMQYVHLVEELLEWNVPVLIYNGQNDLIVETPGTFKWVELLHHTKADEFRYA